MYAVNQTHTQNQAVGAHHHIDDDCWQGGTQEAVDGIMCGGRWGGQWVVMTTNKLEG